MLSGEAFSDRTKLRDFGFGPGGNDRQRGAGAVGKKVVLVTSLLAAAAGVVLATLFLPVETGTGSEELRQVRLGRPFWFVVQDQSRYTPPGDVWTTRFLSPWECHFTVVWWRFAASAAVVAGGLAFLVSAAAFVIRRVCGYQSFQAQQRE